MSNKMPLTLHCSDAVSGLGGWSLAHPRFGFLANPIPSRGAHCNTAFPPGLENLIALLFIELPKHEQLKWPVDSIEKVYYNARTYTHAT